MAPKIMAPKIMASGRDAARRQTNADVVGEIIHSGKSQVPPCHVIQYSTAATRFPRAVPPPRTIVTPQQGQAMLARLSIRDIVLIDRLDLDFASGLSVLTGE